MDAFLVLTGGGAKIASHFGMWVAARDRGVVAVGGAGVSAGALAMMMIAQHRDEDGTRLALGVGEASVHRRTTPLAAAYRLLDRGGAWDNRPLLSLIRQNFDPSRVVLPFCVGVVGFESGEYMDVWIKPPASKSDADAIFESTCIPLIWPPHEREDGTHWWDGGVRMQNPIGAGIEAGADRIMALSCNPRDIPTVRWPLDRERDRPSSLAGLEVAARAWEIIMHQNLVQHVEFTDRLTRLVRQWPDGAQRPRWKDRELRAIELIQAWYPGDPGDTLDFDGGTMARRFQDGHSEMRRVLDGLHPA